MITLLALLSVVAAPPVAVQAPATATATCAADLPADLAAWRTAHPLAHGFVVGRAVDLVPVPVAQVRLAAQPSRPLSGSHLASAGFAVTQAGTYRVAAGGATAPIRPLWLDVVGMDHQPLNSTGHGHGPACSGITKVVEFNLKPGRYTFLATGLTSATPVRVMILRKR